MLQRRQAYQRASFFVRNVRPQEPILDDLKAVFTEDTKESHMLLDSIVKCPGRFRGTIDFWQSMRHHWGCYQATRLAGQHQERFSHHGYHAQVWH